MINTNHLCMQCMKEIGTADICPFCGYRDDQMPTAPYLPPRTWLMDRYLVGKVMSCDGEGATYIGWDNVLQTSILIREFLPDNLCRRNPQTGVVQPTPGNEADYAACLTDYLTRSRALARMRDLSALFPVYDIFELSGTGYAFSEYIESITLEEFLHRNGNKLTFEQTRALMLPAVSTLSSLHSAGFVHGGISSETLFVGKDGKLRFGGFTGLDLRSARGAMKTQLFAGYSAIEQYGFDQKIGPHTDVYAFAACVYRVLAGAAPPDAKSRMEQDIFTLPSTLAGVLPPYAGEALLNALQCMPEARTATIERFREEISAAPNVTEEKMNHIIPDDEPIEEITVPKGKSLLPTLLAMGITLVVLAAVFFFVEFKWGIFGLFETEEPNDASLLVISSEEAPSVDATSALTRKVENFVGQSLEACERNYTSYTFKTLYKVYSDEHPAGTIITQTPAAGTEIPMNQANAQQMEVVVSLGSASIGVPQVQGMTYAAAIEKLWEAGFSYDSITCNTDTPAYNGVVTKVSPAPGSTCNVYEAKIILYVENPVESDLSVPADTEDNREVSSLTETSSKASR